MRYQGVHVSVGYRVHRGDWIGDVGTTGYSGGPHVHFSVHTAPVSDGFVKRVRFEALVRPPGGDLQFESCYIPRWADEIRSTNFHTGS